MLREPPQVVVRAYDCILCKRAPTQCPWQTLPQTLLASTPQRRPGRCGERYSLLRLFYVAAVQIVWTSRKMTGKSPAVFPIFCDIFRRRSQRHESGQR